MLKLIKNIPLATFITGIVFIIIQLAAGLNYPLFRDELYYIDCANHPAFGYVDHPPLSIFILIVWKTFFSDSQLSTRMIPAAAGALLIIITSLITKEFGGSRKAQIFSSLSVSSSLYFLATGGFYSMNVFDSVFWALLFLILIKIINRDNNSEIANPEPEMNKSSVLRAKYTSHSGWLLFGIIAGLGLMNKISVGYLGLAILAAIILTKNRVWLKSKNIWLGGLIAGVIFSPYIIWNMFNDYATIEFIQNAAHYKIAALPPFDFMKEQVLLTNPLNFPVWLVGLAALLFGSLKKYRVIGLTYIIILVILIAMGAKPYYPAAFYTVLLSAGAIYITNLVFKSRFGKSVIIICSIMLVISTAMLSPFVIPVLPPGDAANYIKKLGIMPSSGERSAQPDLPQILADRFGWEELAQKTAKIYNSLPEDEKKYTAVFCENYGEAGAINYYGEKYGWLPRAISGHNSNWLWGYGTDSINTLIIINSDIGDLKELFNEVTEAGKTGSPFVMPFENNRPIFIVHGPKIPMNEIWKLVKFYI